MNNNDTRLGPTKMTGLGFIAQIIAGVGGGVIGTLILFGVLFLASSYFAPVFTGGDAPSFLVFIFMIMVFGASLASNIFGSFFVALVHSDRYKKRTSSLYQIFILNVIIFFASLPVYLIVSKIGLSYLVYVAALQAILSAQASLLILEIVSDRKYALLGVYSGVFSIFVSIILGLLIHRIFPDNLIFLMLTALPIIWGSIGFFSALFNLIYYGIYSLYGVDFLASNISYGRDVAFEEKEMSVEEAEEIIGKEGREKEGREFIEKKE